MTASAESCLVEKGKHKVTTTWQEWTCPVCGAHQEGRTEVSYYDVEPDTYEWTAVAAGDTQDSNTWSGPMPKGLDQEIKFTVTGKWNPCQEGKCEATATDTATADVHELSVERPDYLGLDRTDAGLSGRAVTNATARIDPEPASAIYHWTKCGKCQFVGKTNEQEVTYGITNSATASTELNAEDLKVTATAKNADGRSVSATCTTNFTVVAVDVTLKDWGEQMDEKNDTVIGSYVKRDGSGLFGGYPELAEDAMTQCPVRIEVIPGNLPDGESASLVFPNGNLIVNDDPEVAESSYGVGEINSQLFYLFDESGSLGKKTVEARHDASSAKDVIGYDVCCCTVTICTDCSDLFGRGLWYFLTSMLENMGHSFWKIDMDDDHIQFIPEHLRKYIGKYYGFYPSPTNTQGKAGEYYDVAGDLKEEASHAENLSEHKIGTRSHTWHISLEGCIRGLECVYSIETQKPKYDLACFNCTDVAVSVGRACGAPVPDAGLPDSSIGERLRAWIKKHADWAKESDGTYSCPLGLFVNLFSTNKMYGEIE